MKNGFPLAGGVALVTGAGSGIGRALSQELAQRGSSLALVDVNGAALEETATLCRDAGADVSHYAFDVADAQKIAALPPMITERHGRLTLLINNAGVALGGSFDQTDLEDFEWLMNINFYAPVRFCKAFLPLLQIQPQAHIVNISSLFGLIGPPGQTAYCAAKFGLRGFSESLRHELQDGTVGLSVVHPGGVRTNIAASARMPRGRNSEELANRLKEFEAFLVCPPPKAAQIILDGVKRRAPRILIGNDARMGDIFQRLFPVNYWAWMKKN